jgi:hypothetical protein
MMTKRPTDTYSLESPNITGALQTIREGFTEYLTKKTMENAGFEYVPFAYLDETSLVEQFCYRLG